MMGNKKEALEIIDIIRNRRSVRKFNERKVSKKTLNRLIDMARWAPCPNNFQPWKFMIAKKGNKITKKVIQYLEDKAKKKGIAISIFLKDAIKVLEGAPFVIYVFNTKIIEEQYKTMVSKYYQDKTNLFEHQSIATAIENMLLYAEKIGLGTVWLGSPVMVSKGIERIFNTDFELSAIIALGYYDHRPVKTSRLAVEQIAEFI